MSDKVRKVLACVVLTVAAHATGAYGMVGGVGPHVFGDHGHHGVEAGTSYPPYVRCMGHCPY